MNDSQEGPRRLLIGDLFLDTAKRQVSRHNIALSLPKLSYRLLLALAEAAPNVLNHDELISRVWPGRVVSPETITQRI
jgi:DNA-binding winged helix-turn-helix (wHTH) protein